MLLCAIYAFISNSISKSSFGYIGENITLKVRSLLYRSILKKNGSWFDDKENAPGVLSTVLASDC